MDLDRLFDTLDVPIQEDVELLIEEVQAFHARIPPKVVIDLTKMNAPPDVPPKVVIDLTKMNAPPDVPPKVVIDLTKMKQRPLNLLKRPRRLGCKTRQQATMGLKKPRLFRNLPPKGDYWKALRALKSPRQLIDLTQ
jgi:hypothetical protein